MEIHNADLNARKQIIFLIYSCKVINQYIRPTEINVGAIYEDFDQQIYVVNVSASRAGVKFWTQSLLLGRDTGRETSSFILSESNHHNHNQI